MADKLAVMASSPADYERLGLSRTSIAPWEDGAHLSIDEVADYAARMALWGVMGTDGPNAG
jgi:hypothetical protein